MNRVLTVLKSKTFWGAALGAAAWLTGQPHIGIHEIFTAAGTIISAAGVRDAITKVSAPTPDQG